MHEQHSQNPEHKIGKFRPYLYCQYKTVVSGYNHTDYPSEMKFAVNTGPKMTVVSNTGEKPKVMVKDALNRALKGMIWLDDGELKLFWKLRPERDCDFVIREVRTDVIYHYGRKLYLKSVFGDKQVEADQIGFGYDYFTIHYLHKSELSTKHGVKEYGDLTRRKLTEYLSKNRFY